MNIYRKCFPKYKIQTEDFLELQLLKRARNMLAIGWCQDSCARDKYGRSKGYYDDTAISFCLTGSLFKASWDLEYKRAPKTVSKLNFLSKLFNHYIRNLDNYENTFKCAWSTTASLKIVFNLLEKRLCTIDDKGKILSLWNDAKYRKKYEVLGLMDDVIANYDYILMNYKDEIIKKLIK